MIYFNASEVFASLLSCPNQDETYFFDNAKDPFVAPRVSSDVGDIHTGCCYRKMYEALIRKPGDDMLLPCVMANLCRKARLFSGTTAMDNISIMCR